MVWSLTAAHVTGTHIELEDAMYLGQQMTPYVGSAKTKRKDGYGWMERLRAAKEAEAAARRRLKKSKPANIVVCAEKITQIRRETYRCERGCVPVPPATFAAPIAASMSEVPGDAAVPEEAARVPTDTTVVSTTPSDQVGQAGAASHGTCPGALQTCDCAREPHALTCRAFEIVADRFSI